MQPQRGRIQWTCLPRNLLRLPQRLSALRAPLEQFLSAAVGFVMSGASILLAAAPFGVAMGGSCAADYAVSATLGAMGGYLMLSAGSGTLRYLAALVLLFGLRWALGFIPKSRIQFYTPLLAALAIAVTGLAVALSEPSTVYAYALVGCEAAITATAGMLFVKASRSLQEGAPLTRANGVCTGVGLAILYMGFSAFQIGGFSPARMLAFYCLLLCGCCLSTGAGCAAAIAAGLVAALAGQPQLLAVYCASGLAAGFSLRWAGWGAVFPCPPARCWRCWPNGRNPPPPCCWPSNAPAPRRSFSSHRARRCGSWASYAMRGWPQGRCCAGWWLPGLQGWGRRFPALGL